MTQWWTEFGQKELFPQASFEITDEDYEDSDDDEDDEKVEATTAQKVDAEVSETMQDVEVLAGLEKEFQRVVEGEADVQLPDLDMDPDTDEETISDPDPKRSKPDETMGDVRTLKDALRKAGFQDYVPSVNSEKALNERMQRLFPVTMEFGVLMRLSDGILSRASVVGVSQKCRQNNLAEHALAVARAAHACHAGRQSRFALWAAYSDRCVEASEAGGAAKIVKIGPAVKPDASGFLPRQLLVVRPDQASCSSSNSLRFATPISVWRVARKTVKSGRRYLPDMHLPVSLLTKVQVLLLTPYESKNESWHLRGSRLV